MRTLLSFLCLAVTTGFFHAAAGAEEQRAQDNQNIGRLFTTRGERIKLDEKRQQKTETHRSISTRKQQDETIKLNGVASSSDGKPHVWINGKQPESAKVKVLFDPTGSTGDVDLLLLELDQSISLQPGQTYTRTHKKRYEAFETKRAKSATNEDQQ
jgi:hypothetical protein